MLMTLDQDSKASIRFAVGGATAALYRPLFSFPFFNAVQSVAIPKVTSECPTTGPDIHHKDSDRPH